MLFVAAIALVAAAIPGLAAPLDRRDYPLPNAFVCQHSNWQGSCANQILPLGNCVNEESVGNWISGASSFGPADGLYCVVYETTAGARRRIDFPGLTDLLEIGWNDIIGSYQCYPL